MHQLHKADVRRAEIGNKIESTILGVSAEQSARHDKYSFLPLSMQTYPKIFIAYFKRGLSGLLERGNK